MILLHWPQLLLIFRNFELMLETVFVKKGRCYIRLLLRHRVCNAHVLGATCGLNEWLC